MRFLVLLSQLSLILFLSGCTRLWNLWSNSSTPTEAPVPRAESALSDDRTVAPAPVYVAGLPGQRSSPSPTFSASLPPSGDPSGPAFVAATPYPEPTAAYQVSYSEDPRADSYDPYYQNSDQSASQQSYFASEPRRPSVRPSNRQRDSDTSYFGYGEITHRSEPPHLSAPVTWFPTLALNYPSQTPSSYPAHSTAPQHSTAPAPTHAPYVGEPGSTPSDTVIARFEHRIQPACTFRQVDKGTVADGSANDYLILCNATVRNGDTGGEIPVTSLEPGLTLAWEDPKRTSGSTVTVGACTLKSGGLARECQVALASAIPTEIEIGLVATDASARSKREADTVVLPFEARPLGKPSHLPLFRLTENSSSFRDIEGETATHISSPQSICFIENRMYFSSFKSVFVMEDGNVKLFAGSGNFRMKKGIQNFIPETYENSLAPVCGNTLGSYQYTDRLAQFMGAVTEDLYGLQLACDPRRKGVFIADGYGERVLFASEEGPMIFVAGKSGYDGGTRPDASQSIAARNADLGHPYRLVLAPGTQDYDLLMVGNFQLGHRLAAIRIPRDADKTRKPLIERMGASCPGSRELHRVIVEVSSGSAIPLPDFSMGRTDKTVYSPFASNHENSIYALETAYKTTDDVKSWIHEIKFEPTPAQGAPTFSLVRSIALSPLGTRFTAVEGMAVDEKGVFYLSESRNDRIVIPGSILGEYTTFAGNGKRYATVRSPDFPDTTFLNYNWNPEREKATKVDLMDFISEQAKDLDPSPTSRLSARLARPTTLVFGPADLNLKPPPAQKALYFTDTGSNQIRRINADGTIVTVAGSPRRPAPQTEREKDHRFQMVSDIRLVPKRADKPQENIILASEWSGHSVVEVDPGPGIVKRLAGTGQPAVYDSLSVGCPSEPAGTPQARPALTERLTHPAGIDKDPRNGDLYIAEYGGCRIRKLFKAPDGSSQLITVLSLPMKGCAKCRPYGLRLRQATNSLYFTVFEDNYYPFHLSRGRLMRYDLMTGTLTTLNSEVRSPRGLAVSEDGIIHVVESGIILGTSVSYRHQVTRFDDRVLNTSLIGGSLFAGAGPKGDNPDSDFEIPVATAKSLNNPSSMAVTSVGSFLTETGTGRLRFIFSGRNKQNPNTNAIRMARLTGGYALGNVPCSGRVKSDVSQAQLFDAKIPSLASLCLSNLVALDAKAYCEKGEGHVEIAYANFQGGFGNFTSSGDGVLGWVKLPCRYLKSFGQYDNYEPAFRDQ